MDISQYLDIFMEEAKEHIQSLNQGLLDLEQNPADKEIIQGLFRSAHTMKGMAATMGFELSAKLTHRMESALDLLRQGKMAVSSSFISSILRAVDTLERLVESAGSGQEDRTIDIEQVMAVLPIEGGTAVAQPAPSCSLEELSEHESLVLRAALEKGYSGFRVEITLAAGALLKSVRAYLVMQRLEQYGEVIRTEPPVPDLEAEKFGDSFTVWAVVTADQATIQEEIENIADVHQVAINRLLAESEAVQEIAAAAAVAEQESSQANKLRTGKSVRVDISRLDRLMNLMSELVITRTRLNQISRDLGNGGLAETSDQLSRILLDLQDEVMKVRMVAVEQIFNRFPRMIRDLSQELGKQVNFVITGQETELDRTIIDEIGEPLVHLLRNAIDHGIESPNVRQERGKPPTAELHLSAYHRGDSVFIEVSDDGQGINLEKVKSTAVKRGLISAAEADSLDDESAHKLLFQAGFSTADQVTSVSGRGVGLDIVSSKIQALGGRTLVHSERNRGTTFTIVLPLTLAIMATLQVRVGSERYAIPLSVVDQAALVKREQMHRLQGNLAMPYRGQTIPVVDLRSALAVGAVSQSTTAFVVVVYRGKRLLGLMVDELLGQEEVVVKPLGRFVDRAPGISGATVLGDGSIALILDVMSLV